MDECKCEKCRECCKRIPGISTPDDLVKQAKYLNLSLKEYLETYCVKGYRGSIFEEGETIYFAYPQRRKDNISCSLKCTSEFIKRKRGSQKQSERDLIMNDIFNKYLIRGKIPQEAMK